MQKIVIGLAVLLLLGCDFSTKKNDVTPTETSRDENTATSVQTAPNPSLEKFVGFGWEFSKTLKEKPAKTDVEKVENSHVKGQIDEWRIKTYDGKAVKVYWVSTTEEELLQQVRVWDKNVSLPLGIRIGDEVDKIIEKLGEPIESDGNSAIYYISESVTQDSATFNYSQGKLKEVVWNYYLD